MKDNKSLLEFDERFKAKIRRKKILAWIVKLSIPKFRDMPLEKIIEGIPPEGSPIARSENTVLPGANETKKSSYLDSLFSLDLILDGIVVPVMIGVELQNDPGSDIPLSRGCSSMPHACSRDRRKASSTANSAKHTLFGSFLNRKHRKEGPSRLWKWASTGVTGHSNPSRNR